MVTRRLPSPLSPPWVHLDLSGVTILLVDDDEDALHCLAHLLRSSRAEVVTASSGDAAMDLLRWRRFDVIVSDLEMPGCDGFQLIRRLRCRSSEHGGATPAIALTAHVGTQAHNRALLNGFQMHLGKPVKHAELVVAITGLVQLRA